MEKRDKVASAYRALVKKLQDEGKVADVDERAKMDNMLAEIEKYEGEIREAQKKTEARFAEMDTALQEMRIDERHPEGPENEPDGLAEFRDFLRSGKTEGLEERAMTTGTGSTGGYIVPEKFHKELKEYQADLCPIYNLATKTQWDEGDAKFPLVSGFGTTAIVAEGSAIAESTPTLGQKSLTGYQFMYEVRVPEPLLRKGSFNIEALLPKWWGYSNSGKMEDYFAAGAGTTEPYGLTASASTGDTSTASTLVGDDVVDWLYALKPQYRKRASWVFGDSSVKTIRKLKNPVTTSGALQYLWVPGLAGQPDSLLGRPLYTSDGMPAFAADTVVGVVGDISEFQIVEWGRPMMIRDPYTLASYAQVKFVGYRLIDSALPVAEAVVTCPVHS